MSVGTVFIVGAGPGDPGLLTVRALEIVRSCDVLVYDNLMADEYVALSGAPEKIYVGKGSGRHMMTQEAIGEILVERARAGKTVVSKQTGLPIELPGTEIARLRVQSQFGDNEANEGSACAVIAGSLGGQDLNELYVLEGKE